MNIKIKINELGVIKDSEVEFKPFLIFSGESSVGKSYTAFLIYHLTSLFKTGLENRLSGFVKNKYINDLESNKSKSNWKLFIKAEDFKRWFNHEASNYIGYLLGYDSFKCDIELNIDLLDLEIEIIYPNTNGARNENILSESMTFNLNGKGSYNIQKSIFESKKTDVIGALVSIYLRLQLLDTDIRIVPILLPPARGGIVGYNFSEMSAISNTAGMYREFIKDLDFIKSPSPTKNPENRDLTKLLNNIFNGNIKVKESKLEYHIDNKEKTILPITASASSIKELSPLFLMLKNFPMSQLSVLFEEPEAHLHPLMQQNVASLLAFIINNHGFIQMTTHSDYLLNQINNLIKLGHIKEKNKNRYKELLKKLDISESIILQENMIGSYYFEKLSNGSVKIINQNLKKDNEGISFTTFDKAVEKMTLQTREIDTYLH